MDPPGWTADPPRDGIDSDPHLVPRSDQEQLVGKSATEPFPRELDARHGPLPVSQACESTPLGFARSDPVMAATLEGVPAGIHLLERPVEGELHHAVASPDANAAPGLIEEDLPLPMTVDG